MPQAIIASRLEANKLILQSNSNTKKVPPLLHPADWLNSITHESRILVAGLPGAGKTTISKALSTSTNIVYVELDALYYLPGWKRSTKLSMSASSALTTQSWITDFQHWEILKPSFSRATHLLYIDLPSRDRLQALLKRTLERRRKNEEIWTGVYERSFAHALLSPRSTLWWSIRNTAKYRKAVAETRKNIRPIYTEINSLDQRDTFLTSIRGNANIVDRGETTQKQ